MKNQHVQNLQNERIKGAVRELFAPATPREDHSEERRVEQPQCSNSISARAATIPIQSRKGKWETGEQNNPEPEDNDDKVRNDETGRPSSASSLRSRREGEKWGVRRGWGGAAPLFLSPSAPPPIPLSRAHYFMILWEAVHTQMMKPSNGQEEQPACRA